MNKKLIIATMLLEYFLFACKKEEPVPIKEPEPTKSVVLRYGLVSDYLVLENNADPNTRILGFESEYAIKFEYGYDDNGSTKFAYAYIFAQFDTGAVYLSGERYGTKYVVIKTRQELDGYHFYFKFDLGYDDISISPTVISDTTTVPVIVTSKMNGRTMNFSAASFIRQTFLVIYYDKNQ